jgi:hypothetical protein
MKVNPHRCKLVGVFSLCARQRIEVIGLIGLVRPSRHRALSTS